MVTFWTFSFGWMLVSLTSNKNSSPEGGKKKEKKKKPSKNSRVQLDVLNNNS
jgi:hypothetical protein